MKKINFFLAFILFLCNSLFAQTWDILDKSMSDLGTDWAVAEGGSANSVLSQKSGYVNFTKTNTGSSARWAWLRPATALANITDGRAYSIEIKARVNPIDKTAYPDGTYFEANQLSLRLANKATTPIYLRYGDAENGSVGVTSNFANAYKMNTSEWQIYRIVLRTDLKYDVYVGGVEAPIFEGALGGTNSDYNGIYIGAESQHRCNVDIEYVKVGAGDFFSKAHISSILLSRDSHVQGTETTVSITAYTASFDNGEKLLFSLIDKNDSEIVVPVEVAVEDNMAATNIVIPANIAEGVYFIKVAAKNQINGVDIIPQTVPYEIKDPLSVQTWDILDRDFSVKAWNASPSWSLEKGGNIPTNFVTQQTGYVNIVKTMAGGSNFYGFLISPAVSISANTAYTYEVKARTQAINKELYPDGNGGYEANQIGFLLNNKLMSICLINGDENTGYIASPIADGTGVSPSYTTRFPLKTSEWHVYRLVFNADNTKYDVYVNDELIFEDAPLFNKSGNNNVKIGGESWQRCNMDIEYVRMGTGDLVTGDKPKITAMDLSSDSHVENNARTIRITVNTINILNGEKLTASFCNEEGTEIIDPIDIVINTNRGVTDLTIPVTVPLGKYVITVAAPDDKIGDQTIRSKSRQYVVVGVSPLDSKMLPQVKPVGYVKDIADYKYTTEKKEFIFPSIVDSKKYTVDGKFKNGGAPIDRYYLYYSPHDNPGGMYLSTAPTLDGPWTEYDGTPGMTPGTVMDFAWAGAQSSIVNSGYEKHISGCQVMWNEVQNKFIMYFHGPNEVSHYATSDDLINWTFGSSIFFSYEFSPIGAEASYAKAFEHEIPGLGNKYVILLMNQENQIRKIYWAHSTDGINWTPVTKPLISPDLNYKKIPGTDIKPNYDGGGTGAYGNNVSGPFLMEKDGRYFVFVHGVTNHLLVVEVGESFDMEVHWGEYLKSTDAMFSISGGAPKATRIAAPDFIQDDNGKWYMFFEAGGRLDANIGYAKEDDVNAFIPSEYNEIFIYPSDVKRGEEITIHTENAGKLSVEVIDLSGSRISSKTVDTSYCNIYAPITPGLYLVKVSINENQIKTSKIIVK